MSRSDAMKGQSQIITYIGYEPIITIICTFHQHIQQIFDLSKFYLQARYLQFQSLKKVEDLRMHYTVGRFTNYG